jgi:hypothetical protein
MQFTSLRECLIWTALAASAVVCQAQVMQTPGTMPGRQFPVVPETPHHVTGPLSPRPNQQPPATQPTGSPQQPSVQTGATASAPNPTPALPPSLLDKPAGTARVTLTDGNLSVNANNSNLSEILKDIESSTGMTVDGFEKDSRVFGVYGPGPPRDVLSSLLDGAGYNFLMVGSTDNGTPREVVLTVRSNAPVSAPTPNNSQPEEDEEPPPPPQEQTPSAPVQPPVLPPGDQRPKTPQEMLQELQRLRQQQQTQQQPGQPTPQQ